MCNEACNLAVFLKKIFWGVVAAIVATIMIMGPHSALAAVNQMTSILDPLAINTTPKVVFVKGGNVWIMNTDGSGQQQITAVGGVSWPRLANGIVTYLKDGQIYKTDINGLAPVAIPNASGIATYDLSPDATKLAIIPSANMQMILYRMDIDGNNVTTIYDGRTTRHVTAVAWGTDGYIYFSSSLYHSAYSLTQNVLRIGETAISGEQSLVADWSQDMTQGGASGNFMAFRRGATNSQLWVANTDGSNPHQIPNTPSGIPSYMAAFDQDRNVVYYTMQNGSAFDVYSVWVDGLDNHLIASGVDSSIIDFGKTTGLADFSGEAIDVAGTPLAGVSVALGSLSVVTNPNGVYHISNIPPGTYTLTVSMTGYVTLTQTITLQPGTNTVRNFRLTPVSASDFKVVDLSSKYDGFLYYLAGTDFSVTYTATVNWGSHQPGKVRFITPKGSYDVTTTGTTASRTFNIAADFNPCTTLRVIAIAADGTYSAEKTADFIVMAPFMNGLPLTKTDTGSAFSYYTSSSVLMSLLNEGIDAGVIPETIPLFGDNGFNLTLIPNVNVSIASSGKTSVSMNWLNSPEIEGEVAGVDFSLGLNNLNIYGDYQYPGCYNRWSGSVGFGGHASASKSWPFLLTAGPFVIPMYTKASLELNADINIGVTSLNPVALNGQFDINPYVRGSLGAGIDEKFAVEGWIGGGADFLMQYPQTPHMKDATIYLNGGVTVYALLWKWEQEALRWDWDLNGESLQASKIAASSTSSPRLVSRDYLNGTSEFGSKTNKTLLNSFKAGSESYTSSLTPLQTSIFPYSEPRLSSAGTKVSLTWLTDNTSRSSINRTMTEYSSYDGSNWSAEQPIADDGTADFSPNSLTFDDGSVVAVWEDEKNIMPDSAAFNDMLSNLEISAAVNEPVSVTWNSSQRLTNNSYLDRSPKLAGISKNNVMLTWIANEANNVRGSSTNPNKIWCSIFNGTSWSTPLLAAQIPFGIVKYSLAYDGSLARLVMSLDTDGDSATVADHELYLLSYDNSAWGALTRLTNDTSPVADDNPQVAVDPDNDFVLTWLKGSEISSVINFAMEDRTVVRGDRSYSSNLADFKQITAPDGKMALVWAEASASNSSDIFTAVYDPIYDLWGAPKQLTSDAETEKNITAAFLGSETLVAVYNRTLMGQTPGATDLYMLTYTMGNDLALKGGSLSSTPPNPSSGDSVTLSVTAMNLGDSAQEAIPVAFFQGDPANGGAKIGETTIAGPFKPGDEQNVSINWSMPYTATPVTIYAVIDPTSALDPVNRGNNVISKSFAIPDLSISNISWLKLTDKLISITARVTNSGSIPSAATTVTFRRDAANGTNLNSQGLPLLSAGESMDFNYIWDITGLTEQQYTVYAIADEESVVTEFDETNNAGSSTIPVNLANVLATLTVQIPATGNGNVTSTPPGIACNVTCSGQFPWGSDVVLHASPATYSIFSGWATPYSGTNDCTVSMNGANSATAMFVYDAVHRARIYRTNAMYYPSLITAYNEAMAGEQIQARAELFSESLTIEKNVRFKGGYDSDFHSATGKTGIHGTLTVKGGSLTVENLQIQ
jgi:hypothetical protein